MLLAPDLLKRTLAELWVEHQDLDTVNARLSEETDADELMLRRLKKKKLAIKDRITYLQRCLDPDEYA